MSNPEGWTKGATPETWYCIDCGVNTAPSSPTRTELEREFAAVGRSSFTVSNQSEVYHVHEWVWSKAGMGAWTGCLCIGCLEQRIGRRLIPDDFSDHIFNTRLPGTPRLLERQGRYDPLGDWEAA